jgi:sialidase-1
MPTELFRNGRGYRAVRIPAIAAVDSRRLVAFAVGRWLISDHGPSDLLVRTSPDGGSTWTPQRPIVRGWWWRTVDNPTVVVDRAGSLHLIYQESYRRLLYRVSPDAGATWSEPTDITGAAAASGALSIERLAPGPGAGVRLASARLVVPLWVGSGRRSGPTASLTIFSDDDGTTWQAGELIAGPGGAFANPSETALAALPDGTVLASLRQGADRRRVFSRSPDGASAWSALEPSEHLFEPGSHAALAALTGGLVVFGNPDSRASHTPPLRDGKRTRENLTLRISRDAGSTWGEQAVLDPGPAGYLALAADGSGGLHALWEHGRRPGTALWPTSIVYQRVT